MATIKQVFSTESTLTVTGLDSLVDGGNVNSAAVDNTTDLYLSAEVEVKLNSIITTGVEYVKVFLLRSNDGVDFSTAPTSTENNNALFLCSILMQGNTSVTKVFRVEQLPPHWKLRFVNECGDALTAASVVYRGVNLSNA